MRLRYCLLSLALLAVYGMAASSVVAESPKQGQADVQTLQQRLEQAEAQIRSLQQQLNQRSSSSYLYSASQLVDAKAVVSQQSDFEARLAALEKKVGAAAKDEGEDTTKEKFSVKVGGRIMYDSTWGTDDGLEATNIGDNFRNGREFRRVRIFTQGKGYGVFDYKVQLDFAKAVSSPVLKDVYMGLTDSPIGKVRVGHFKEPFSLEELTSSKYITFMERSLPNAMVPARSLGWMVFDQWAGEMGTWAVGSFFDDANDHVGSAAKDGDVDNDDNEARGVTGRVTRLLYWDDCTNGRHLIHVGSSFRWVDVEEGDRIRFRAKPEIHDTYYLLGVATFDADDYWQWGAEGAVVWGPLSIQGEYIATHIDNTGIDDADLWGAYVYASYFLTGENRKYSRSHGTFSRVTPNENFWWVDSCNGICKLGRGAWEVAARWSYLDFDDSGLVSQEGHSGTLGELWNLTAGVNWYLNPHMRVMFNYVHSDLDDSVTGNQADVDAFMTRMQVDF